jgi:hypothetical protein
MREGPAERGVGATSAFARALVARRALHSRRCCGAILDAALAAQSARGALNEVADQASHSAAALEALA